MIHLHPTPPFSRAIDNYYQVTLILLFSFQDLSLFFAIKTNPHIPSRLYKKVNQAKTPKEFELDIMKRSSTAYALTQASELQSNDKPCHFA